MQFCDQRQNPQLLSAEILPHFYLYDETLILFLSSDGISDPSEDLANDHVFLSESQATKAVDDVPENIREEVQIQTPAAESELPSISQVEDDKVGSTPERNGGVSNSNGETDNPSPKESVTKGCFACSSCSF